MRECRRTGAGASVRCRSAVTGNTGPQRPRSLRDRARVPVSACPLGVPHPPATWLGVRMTYTTAVKFGEQEVEDRSSHVTKGAQETDGWGRPACLLAGAGGSCGLGLRKSR